MLKACFSLCILTLLQLDAIMGMDPTIVEEQTSLQLGCHIRMYTYQVTQSDSMGRQCWDTVRVRSCWGHCDSNEISDWRFPYKRSYHPVCVYAGRTKAVAILRHCDPTVDKEAQRYEYMEAIACNCQTCSSSDTSCETPHTSRSANSVPRLTIYGTSEQELDY